MKPLCSCMVYIQDNILHANALQGIVRIENYVEEFYAILKLSTGHNKLEDIAKETGYDLEVVEQIIEFCVQNRIVFDSTKLHNYYHLLSSNPMVFRNSLSPEEISNLVHPLPQYPVEGYRPQTTRDFDKTAVLSEGDITKFLVKVFGSKYPQYPSAGGMYSIKAYVLLSRDHKDLKRGLYIFENNILVRLSVDINIAHVYKAFESRELVENSGLIVILVSDLSSAQTKYSNRAYRYANIEAGHISQNFYLSVETFSLSICEYGGFCDQFLQGILNLKEDQYPLITLLIGKKDTEAEAQNQHLRKVNQEKFTAYELMEQYVGSSIRDLQIRSYTYNGEQIPLFSAYTKFNSNGAELMAFGNDASINLAVIKAIAESIERQSSGNFRFDIKGKLSDLPNALDPRLQHPLHSGYEKLSEYFLPFDPSSEYEWIKGVRYSTGEEKLIIVDSVFYPFPLNSLGRKPINWASSNGVAAHTDMQKALINGMCELIERDAIMVHWYGDLPVYSIEGDLPLHIVDRKVNWEVRHGYKFSHYDLTLDSIPVVITTFYNPDKYPSFGAGAGCGFTYNEAIEKSFNEAEFMLTSWAENPQKEIDSSEVQGVHGHALLFFYPTHLDKLHRIFGAESKMVNTSEYHHVDILGQYDPIIVTLKEKTFDRDLCVVHLTSEKLMPINFGYGLEAYNHTRFSQLELKWAREYPSFPHYFA